MQGSDMLYDEVWLPEELYDEVIECKEFILDHDIRVELECAPEHLQMSDRSAFLVVWPASVAMANLLIRLIDEVEDSTSLKVLELGSGVGLCGLALAKLPIVSKVVLSDADTQVLAQLQKHIARYDSKASAERLFWGDRCDIDRVLATYSRTEGSPTGFDLIVGTDVTYCSDYIEGLMQTAAECVKPMVGRVFLSYSMPRFAQMESQVFQMAEKYGLKLITEHPSKTDKTKIIELRKS